MAMINADNATPLLQVENLNIRFKTPTGISHVVRNMSFSMGREKLAIVGESGSGKSQSVRAILGLSPGQVTADRLDFNGETLLNLDAAHWRKIRGKRISMIMQDPKYSLNPVMRIGQQLVEACRDGFAGKNAKARAMEMLTAVKIRDPERVYRAWPHELSGGMGQRAMIAMMLITEPELLIADEPTSALDVTVRLQVLAILDDLVQTRDMGLIFISHDLNLVSSFCDRVLVMYAGQIMEELNAKHLGAAKHPYTRGLLACLPELGKPVAALQTLTRDDAWKTELPAKAGTSGAAAR
jgi:peptide/nickel transport system ATP-binding protein